MHCTTGLPKVATPTEISPAPALTTPRCGARMPEDPLSLRGRAARRAHRPHLPQGPALPASRRYLQEVAALHAADAHHPCIAGAGGAGGGAGLIDEGIEEVDPA